MAKPLSNGILGKLGQTQQLYYRLLLVVGPARTAKTAALRNVANRIGASVINLNQELSQRLLDEYSIGLPSQRKRRQIVTWSRDGFFFLSHAVLLRCRERQARRGLLREYRSGRVRLRYLGVLSCQWNNRTKTCIPN